MRKLFLNICSILILTFTTVSFGQAVVFSDNFDSYVAGQQLACQNPIDWTTWTNTPCDLTLDAYVSSVYSFSGAQSTVIVFNNDEVKPLGNLTSGNWHISFMAYIPAGFNGYFNTLIEFIPPSTYQWGLEVYFNTGGIASVNAGGLNATTFPFSYNTWMPVDVFVNLGTDQAELRVNNNSIYTWQWTLGYNGSGGSLMLGGNDFWGATAQDQMYIDDYTFWDLVVPVELTSFTADVTNQGNVVLNWSTATETNNQKFDIERRTTNGEYNKIGAVTGAGTTTEPQFYSFTDNTVSNGKYYYRLKQIDFDGTYEYLKEIEVDVNSPATFILGQNFPNPFNPETKIEYSIPENGYVKLSVYNVVGEQVAELVNGITEAGSHEMVFDASGLPSGAYFYKLQTENSIQVKKMLLTK